MQTHSQQMARQKEKSFWQKCKTGYDQVQGTAHGNMVLLWSCKNCSCYNKFYLQELLSCKTCKLICEKVCTFDLRIEKIKF